MAASRSNGMLLGTVLRLMKSITKANINQINTAHRDEGQTRLFSFSALFFVTSPRSKASCALQARRCEVRSEINMQSMPPNGVYGSLTLIN